jgi:hypothetical protein
MNGIDLQSAIERKLQANAARQYARDPESGVLHRLGD